MHETDAAALIPNQIGKFMGKNLIWNISGAIAVLCLTYWPWGIGDKLAFAQENFRANAAVQKTMAKVAANVSGVMNRADDSAKKADIDKVLAESVEQLKKTSGGKAVDLIPEVVFYEYSCGDEKLAWAAEFILGKIVMSSSQQEVIAVAAANLFIRKNPGTNRIAELLYGICSRKATVVDYGPIFQIVTQGKGKISDDLFKYMFYRSPHEALHGCMWQLSSTPDSKWTPEKKEIALAEHEIDDTIWRHECGFLEKSKVEPAAAAALEKLSHNKNWWARLYVAEIMRQHPGFRKASIVEQFQKDENRLVRETVKFEPIP
jgi:hypothetical protein